jgi:hypothetical protein
MSKAVTLNDDPAATVEEIMTRIHRAQLANIKVDYGDVAVSETYPAKLPELWAGRPVIVYGLYQGGQDTTILVSGDVEGEHVMWPLKVNFPDQIPDNDVIAKVWARNKIEDLMQQTFYAGSPEVEEAVTAIALEYRLMSQYTSFVAVDEKDLATLKQPARPPRRMVVPVPLPDGVSFEGVFGGTVAGTTVAGRVDGGRVYRARIMGGRGGAGGGGAGGPSGPALELGWYAEADSYADNPSGGAHYAAPAGPAQPQQMGEALWRSTAAGREVQALKGIVTNGRSGSVTFGGDTVYTSGFNVRGSSGRNVLHEQTVEYPTLGEWEEINSHSPVPLPSYDVSMTPRQLQLEIALDTRVSLEYEVPTELNEIIGFLNELVRVQTGIADSILLDPKVIAADPRAVTITQHDMKLRIALRALLDKVTTAAERTAKNELDYAVRKEAGIILVSNKDRLAGKLEATAAKNGDQAETQERLRSDRARIAYAYLLGASNGRPDARLKTGIEEIDKKLVALWTKELPALNKTLNIVVRDRSVPEAVAAVAAAAGLKVEIVPGSVEDSCALTHRKELRIAYLDSRNASAAQALDWILQPNRLNWSVANGKVVVASARREEGLSPWVYDVSLLVIPSADELKDEKERTKRLTDSFDTFQKTVTKALNAKPDGVFWYAPGQLILFGEEKTHAAAATLLEQLADPNAKLEGDLAALQKVTAPRAQAGKEALARWADALEAERVLVALDAHSWSLLAAAAGGKLNVEALTELQIAWRSPAIADAVKANGLLGMRSLWAITESAAALPKEMELAALAKSATVTAAPLVKLATDNEMAFLTTLYAALTLKENSTLGMQARQQALSAPKPNSTLAAALFFPVKDVDAKTLTEALAAARGDDRVVLTAFACRRTGGDAWSAFRASAREMMGTQPLSGGVVVLVNNLSRASLPAIAQAAK